MTQNALSIGRFTVDLHEDAIVLSSPEATIKTNREDFVRGTNHLLKMGLDLEGEAELSGGLIFRVEGDRVRLTLGKYSETFPTETVATFFERLTKA